MRRPWLGVVSLALVGGLCFADDPPAEAAYDPGLIGNGSFEAWDQGGGPTGWTVTVHRKGRGAEPVTLRAVADPAPRDGQACAELDFADWTAVSLRRVVAPAGRVGAKYRLEAHVRTSAGFAGAMWASLASKGGLALNAGKRECSLNSPQAVAIPLGPDWTKVAVELTWEDAEERDLVLLVSAKAPGTVWLDRLSLVEAR